MKTHAITTSIRRSIVAASILGTLGVTGISAHAAVVTWGAATNISGDSDVSAAGTRVVALNFGDTGVASATVNGTTFNAFPVVGFGTNGLSTVSGPFANLSASYQGLLSSGVSGLSAGFATTVGQNYLIEVWSNNSVSPNSIVTVTSGGSSVSLSSNVSGSTGGLGQFAIGTFTADSAVQNFSFTGANFTVNAAQLRLLPSAVPEPGSALAGMLALGVCFSGLVKRSRRQRLR